MRLLDLFCGAGGAGMGYYRAGFEVVGVDLHPQKHYPFEFHQADALEYLVEHGREFDAIHASPPCQAFTVLKAMWNSKKHTDMLSPVRVLLRKIGRPYVIENVPGAPMSDYFTLCGTMFGLGTGHAQLWRHRQFEIYPSMLIMTPPCNHKSPVIGVYGGHGRDRRRPRVVTVTGNSGGFSRNGQEYTVKERREAMGIDWMSGAELSQAIPPAYTEWIGKQMLEMIAAS